MEKEKKEIGKLLELLNEYEKTLEPNLQIEWIEVGIKSTPEIVISKKFGFIKRLVENDKIDIHNIPPISITKGGEETAYNEPVMLDDSLLMLLSISENPINDLLLYLK